MRSRTLAALSLACALLLGAVTVFLLGEGPPDEALRRSRVDGPTTAGAERALPRAEQSHAEAMEDGRESQESAAAPPSAGAVHGRLRDHSGQAVATGRIVLLRREQPIAAATVDLEGRFRFENLRPGTYIAIVDPESLPKPYLVPWMQAKTISYGSSLPLGFYAREIVVPATGGEFEVELVVAREAIVEGRVLGRAGEGVEDVFVRLSHRTAGMRLSIDSRTDNDGSWLAHGVYPGTYRLHIYLAREHADVQASRPYPLDLHVEEGTNHYLETVLGVGACSVTGLVLDEQGEPFEDAEILASYAGDPSFNWGNVAGKTWTGPDGRFVLHGLAAERIHVSFEPHGYKPGNVGGNRLAYWVEPLELDLSACSGSLDVGVARLQRSRPYFVQGRVTLDAQWAEASRASLRSVELEITQPTAERLQRTDRIARWPQAIDVDGEDGSFRWGCETPHDDLVLTVRCRRVTQRHILLPAPSQTETLDIHIP